MQIKRDADCRHLLCEVYVAMWLIRIQTIATELGLQRYRVPGTRCHGTFRFRFRSIVTTIFLKKVQQKGLQQRLLSDLSTVLWTYFEATRYVSLGKEHRRLPSGYHGQKIHMQHRFEFGPEKAWARMTIRTEFGIANDAPWFAMAVSGSPSDSESSVAISRQPWTAQPRAVSAWICDIAWHLRHAQFGSLVFAGSASEKTRKLDKWSALSTLVGTWYIPTAKDELWTWMLAADGWILLGETPLDEAIGEVAAEIGLPVLHLCPGPADSSEFVHQILDPSGQTALSTMGWTDEQAECWQNRLSIASGYFPGSQVMKNQNWQRVA